MAAEDVEETEVEGAHSLVEHSLVEHSPATLQHLRRPALPEIEEPSILTFLQENGQAVTCISSTEEEHFSVQSLQPAHGRTFSQQDQANEA